MKRLTIALAIFVFGSLANASEIIPPDMLLPMIIKGLKQSPDSYVNWEWAIDFEIIKRNDPKMEKDAIITLLRSIDPGKIVLAEHEHLSTTIEMVEPLAARFMFEGNSSENTKGPPVVYRLVKIERKN